MQPAISLLAERRSASPGIVERIAPAPGGAPAIVARDCGELTRARDLALLGRSGVKVTAVHRRPRTMGADMSCTAARKGKYADVVISRESVREAVQSARSQRRASRLFSGLSEEGNAYIKDHDVEAQLAGAVRLLAAERPRNAAAFLSRVFKAMADEQLGLDPASLEHPPSPVSMKPRNC